MIDRRLIKHFDWVLLTLLLILGVFGLVTIYSAVMAGIIQQKVIFWKQVIWYGFGLLSALIVFSFHYRLLDRWAYWIYGVCNALLVSVLIFGRTIAGSQRWLILGPVSLQPSELVKIAVIIVLAHWYSKSTNPQGLSLKELLVPAVLLLIPFILVSIQPDLGTAMVIALIAASITLYKKIEKKTLVLIVICITVAIPMVWSALKPYQQQRILTFLDPERDSLGAGYHIIQSKIAIGSGMITGKGYLEGTQNALSFLPEQHTDFIFSVLAEEWGLAGASLLLLFFLFLIIWGLNIAHNCRSPFGMILAVGVTAMIFWQVVINIGMVMGLMPVVGMPLPFISYGGSSMLTNMIGIGLLMNISMRRFMIK